MQMDEKQGKYPTNPASNEDPLHGEKGCKTQKVRHHELAQHNHAFQKASEKKE